jgi:outer membrane protein TolC
VKMHRKPALRLKAALSQIGLIHRRFLVLALLVLFEGFAQAQSITAQGGPEATTGAPLTVTFQDALQRARLNEPQYRSAMTDLGLAHEDRVQARAGLLPSLNYNNSFIYTEGTGPLPATCAGSTQGCPTSRFIANNGVHEYISQAAVHESVSLTNYGDYRKSSAMLAQARARAEVAMRGLVVTVTQAYYGLVVAQRKICDRAKSGHGGAAFSGYQH